MTTKNDTLFDQINYMVHILNHNYSFITEKFTKQYESKENRNEKHERNENYQVLISVTRKQKLISSKFSRWKKFTNVRLLYV